MPLPVIVIGLLIVTALVYWAVVGGGNRDKDLLRIREETAAFQRRAKDDPDWAFTEHAKTLGLTIDLPADTVTAPGQADGRFTGSLLRVETLGQINRRVTLTRVALVGIFALAAQKKEDDRELYLTVEGDGFQIAVRVEPQYAEGARRFAAAYNTRSGGLAKTDPTATAGIASQLADLGRMHAAGQLTDDEFATAKAQLLGPTSTAPQDAVPSSHMQQRNRTW